MQSQTLLYLSESMTVPFDVRGSELRVYIPRSVSVLPPYILCQVAGSKEPQLSKDLTGQYVSWLLSSQNTERFENLFYQKTAA